MPDLIFSDPRLAAVYDAFEAGRDDLDPYVALADELDARRVVDLGCGTGCLALRLAAAGRTVTAIDPAAASVDVARRKPGAERVVWLEGGAEAITDDRSADLVLMTGNAAQAVVSDHDWSALLGHVHDGLVGGGTFAFESRRPDRRAWEGWEGAAPTTLDVPGIGPVERALLLMGVELPLVTFRFTYRFADGTTVVSDSTIRFRDRDEIAADLHRHGFTLDEVRDAPDRPGRELVVLART